MQAGDRGDGGEKTPNLRAQKAPRGSHKRGPNACERRGFEDGELLAHVEHCCTSSVLSSKILFEGECLTNTVR